MDVDARHVEHDDEVEECGSSGNSVESPSSFECEKISDGLYLLHQPEEGVKIVCDILFFHGLQWDDNTQDDIHVSTWKSRDQSDAIPWPKKWIPIDVPGARIWLVSYDSSIKRDPTHGNMDLFLVTEMIMHELFLNSAGVGRGDRPVILVGHCFGGLVVKSLCVKVAEIARKMGTMDSMKEKADMLLKSIEGIFFYATPHHGFEITQVMNVNTTSLSQGSLIEVVKLLSESAARLHGDFEAVEKWKYPQWSYFGVGEAVPTQLGPNLCTILVKEGSARHGTGHFSLVSEDHISICRPSDRTSNSYQFLLNLINEVVKGDQVQSNERVRLPQGSVSPVSRKRDLRFRDAPKSEVHFQENSWNSSGQSKDNDDESQASKSSAESPSRFQYKESEGASESDHETRVQLPDVSGGSEQAEWLMDDGEEEGHEVEEQALPQTIPHLLSFWGIWVSGCVARGSVTQNHKDVAGEGETPGSALSSREERLGFLKAFGGCETLKRVHLNVEDFPSAAKESKAFFSSLAANSALEEMWIKGEWQKGSKFVIYGLLEVIRRAPSLQMLGFCGLGKFDKDNVHVKSLADALAHSSASLKSFFLEDLDKGHGEWLMSAFTGADCNRSIRTLHFSDQIHSGVGQSLVKVLSSNQTLKRICFDEKAVEQSSVRLWRRMGHSLLSNTSLDYLEVDVSIFRVGDKVTELLAAAKGKPKPVIKVCIDGHRNLWQDEYTWKYVVGILTKFNSLKALRFYNYVSVEGFPILPTYRRVLDVLDVLEENVATLQEFEMENFKGSDLDGGWKPFFDAIRYNTSVTHLGLKNAVDLDEDSFREFMALLQVNSTLRSVDYRHTSWEEEGKGPLIDEILKRNAERESYFAVLKQAKLKFHEARAGRLFFCGAAYAGKTRLKKTLMRTHSRSWLGIRNKVHELWRMDLWRTTGIEVDFLQDDEDMQIAVWDLAGQEIFRTLQDVLFPRANQHYIFLFVFSPYDEEKKQLKSNLEEELRERLEDWLRFVASNSRIGSILPQMIVVFTHWDQVVDLNIDWATTIVKQLQKEFEGMVDLFTEKVFFIDAYKTKHVEPLLKQVLTSFKELLHEKSPIVPQVCSKIISILANPTENIPIRPIWRREQFYDFCFLMVERFNFFEGRDRPTIDVWNSIASYLHDVGSIVLIPESDLVAVYPNWLTHSFLGELIMLGHNFSVYRNTSHKYANRKPVVNDGHVSEKELGELLQSLCTKQTPWASYSNNKLEIIDSETLKLLLVKLDLCYKLKDSTHYFMPSIITEGSQHSRSALSWNAVETGHGHHNYFGFRLQCQDRRRTALTSSFFTRLQIVLRNKVIANSSLATEVKSARGYSMFYMDGHEIIMEVSSQSKVVGTHVDVLVRGSALKKKDEAVKFVMRHIIGEIRDFCASPRGCQGVTLVLGLLSTRCVELLIPPEHRGDKQVILVEELKQHLQRSVETHLEEDDYTNEESLLNYEHVWPEVQEGNHSRYSELAKDLLWDSEVEGILRVVLSKRKSRLHDLSEATDEMKREVAKDNITSTTTDAESDDEIRESDIQDPAFTAEVNQWFSISKIQLDEPNHVLIDKFGGMEEKLPLDGMNKVMRHEKGVESIQGGLNQIISVQQRIDSTLITFQSTLDEMIGLPRSLEQARIPKLPFLSTEDINFLLKIEGAGPIGTPVRLHFMCESMFKPHAVEGQRGLELMLEEGNFQRLKRLCIISTKIVWFFLKAGLQVTVGLGQRVQDPDCFEPALPLLIGKAAVKEFAFDETVTRLEKQELWFWLRDVLEQGLKGNYRSYFNVRRVRYSKWNDGGHAWFCSECAEIGKSSGKLDWISD